MPRLVQHGDSLPSWWRVIAAGLSLCAVATPPAHADVGGTADVSPQSAPQTLADLIAQFRRDNPQLKQARQSYFAAKLQVPIAGALPAPQFGLLEQANTPQHRGTV